MNGEIIKQFFPKAVKNFEESKCSTCGKDIKIENFKDELSIKEYRISGMCQECQNKTFGY